MSDQFNISFIPGFSISQIEPSDLPTVLDCMNEIYRELPEKSWFSMDEREDLIRYMTVSGFGLKAEAVATDGRKELAAVFVARTSDLGDENLGSYLEPDDSQLSLVAHMEIAMVRSAYRGNGLQKKLMGAAEEQLRSAGFRWLMGTAHPDNVYSVHNFEQLGYKLVTKALKYGGLPRYIFCKKI